MLKITVIANNPASSLVAFDNEQRRTIAELPEKLRAQVLEAIIVLNKCDVSNLEYSERSFTLSRADKNYSVDPTTEFISDEFLIPFVGTIKLLHWYLGPHLRARDPERLGGAIICCECGLTQCKGKPSATYCEFAGCPSHARWAEIIEGYEPPKYLSNEAFANVMQKLQDNKRSSTDSSLTDDANKWIQKG